MQKLVKDKFAKDRGVSTLETSLILMVLFPLFLGTFGALGAFRTHTEVREILSNTLTQFRKSPYKIHSGNQDYWIRLFLNSRNAGLGEDLAGGEEALSISKFKDSFRKEVLNQIENKVKSSVLNCSSTCAGKYRVEAIFAKVVIDKKTGQATKINLPDLGEEFLLGALNSTIDLESKLKSFPMDAVPFPYAVPTALNGAERVQDYGRSYSYDSNEHNDVSNFALNYLRNSLLIGVSVEVDLGNTMQGKLLEIFKNAKIFDNGKRFKMYQITSPRLVF